MLGRKRRLTSGQELADPQPPLLLALPNSDCSTQYQPKEQRRVQLYSGSPLNIKLFVPAGIESVPSARSNPSPCQSSSEKETDPSAKHSAALEESVETCEGASVGIGVKKSLRSPDIKNTGRIQRNRGNRTRNRNRSLSASPPSAAFNRIPIQPNIIGNNVGNNAVGPGMVGGGGIILTPGHGHGNINMLQPGRGGINVAYPGHHHIQTGIRINNVPTQHSYPPHKDDHHHYNKHPNEVVKNEELTYNSGAAPADKHIFALWIWLMSLFSVTSIEPCCLSVYWINPSLVLSIVAILVIHYLVESALQSTLQPYRPRMVVLSPSMSVDLFGPIAATIGYDR
ncbi:hypothetical protein M5D96_010721 [Drosophila gunungcola]|uniref:Uncharacterized protein n=1 Tax=Drosophila gunungcola TaxID=103775 RepID=A0A9P9YG85_9MUSC|nr:hypothetical protein M5D96_010721 [Drosophila gunungcola]